MRAANAANQTAPCMGFTNEKAPGIAVCGFLIMILMPSSMKSIEKSTTVSLAAVIVKGATTISASYRNRNVGSRIKNAFSKFKNNSVLLSKILQHSENCLHARMTICMLINLLKMQQQWPKIKMMAENIMKKNDTTRLNKGSGEVVDFQ
jgi:hypothetical protein